ncbi:MAG: hypothetical protein HFG20_05790 [Anaerotruncus sp.]|nr:hypothetical protein [Anaerotruncus sp.]
MHILHSILVHLPGDVPASEGESRGEYLERIRSYAETETEDFYEIAFDWRETATAGGWSNEYPENVLLGSEDGKKLIRELKKILETQTQEIRYNMEALINCFGGQLSGIVFGIQNGAVDGSSIQATHYVFQLKKMAKLLDGEYFYDSCFYDTAEHSKNQ